MWAVVGGRKGGADELRTNETDDRRRIYLGTVYANKRITITAVDVENDHADDAVAAAYRDVSESATDLAEGGSKYLTKRGVGSRNE